MSEESAWERWGRQGVATALATAVAWFAFGLRREVPILDWFDLAMHEIGHMLTSLAPRLVMTLGGSLAQMAVPLGLAWYFGISRRDAAGGGFCLAWAGASMWDVSVYIADAPTQALPLVGGGQHDWALLLGPQGWDVLGSSGAIAGIVDLAGGVLATIGIGVAAWAAVRGLAARPRPLDIETLQPASTAADPWLAAANLPFKHEAAAGPSQ